MGYTKKEFIEGALAELGIATYIFNIEPEQLTSALNKLDAMMATWNFQGIRVGYPLPSSPSDSDISQQTNVSDSANEAIVLNLAIRLAPSYGKVVSTETKVSAKSAYNTLLGIATTPEEMSLGMLPKGAGYKCVDSVYINDINKNINAGNDSDIILE